MKNKCTGTLETTLGELLRWKAYIAENVGDDDEDKQVAQLSESTDSAHKELTTAMDSVLLELSNFDFSSVRSKGAMDEFNSFLFAKQKEYIAANKEAKETVDKVRKSIRSLEGRQLSQAAHRVISMEPSSTDTN